MRAALLGALGLSAAGPGSAQGREDALFLLLPIGAQSVGLARAMTSVATPESAFWNPAGLAGLDRSRVLVYRGEHFAGEALGLSSLARGPWGVTLGLSYALVDSGNQDLTDETGAIVGSISVRQHQALASVARSLTDRSAVGVNVKYIQFRQGCRGQCPDGGVRATTYALDLGTQFHPIRSRPLVIGASVAHLGPRLRVEDVARSDPLPARLRLGASYAIDRAVAEEILRVRGLIEVEDRARDPGDPTLLVAAEVSLGTTDQVVVRAGYAIGGATQLDGAGIGLGLRYERFELGIARSLASGGPALEQEPVHLTLGLAF